MFFLEKIKYFIDISKAFSKNEEGEYSMKGLPKLKELFLRR